jgi:hypothetical protein
MQCDGVYAMEALTRVLADAVRDPYLRRQIYAALIPDFECAEFTPEQWGAWDRYHDPVFLQTVRQLHPEHVRPDPVVDAWMEVAIECPLDRPAALHRSGHYAHGTTPCLPVKVVCVYRRAPESNWPPFRGWRPTLAQARAEGVPDPVPLTAEEIRQALQQYTDPPKPSRRKRKKR